MGVENLLGVGERLVQSLADDAQVLVHLCIVDVVALLPVGHLDLLGESGVIDGRKAATAELSRCQMAYHEEIEARRRSGGEELECSRLTSLRAAALADCMMKVRNSV